MPAVHKYVSQLRILDSTGSLKYGPITGKVRIEGEGAITVSTDSDGQILLNMDPAKQSYDDYYVRKYDIIKSGGTYDGNTYSGMPYYVSKLDGVAPADNNLFLLGNDCSQLGLFQR